MNSLRVRFHSFVDLITNSSSTVYVFTHRGTEGILKDMVNGLLSAGGSNETFDSLFTYKEEYSDRDYEELFNHLVSEWVSEEFPVGAIAEAKAWRDNGGKEWGQEFLDFLKTIIERYDMQEAFANFVSDEDYNADRGFVVTARDPDNEEAARLLNRLHGLFEYQESYDY